MKVWDDHTKGMDHLHRRAEEQISTARAQKRKTSSASSPQASSPKSSQAGRRKQPQKQAKRD